MCGNLYANILCTNCFAATVRCHVVTAYCTLSRGTRICGPALRELHEGPTQRTTCVACDNQEFSRIDNFVYHAPVVQGYTQADSERAVADWRSDQALWQNMRPMFLDTGIETAQSSGELLLEQPFDIEVAEAIAIAPPQDMRYHTFIPRYSTGYYSPRRDPLQPADNEAWYPGSESQTASRTTYQGGPHDRQNPLQPSGSGFGGDVGSDCSGAATYGSSSRSGSDFDSGDGAEAGNGDGADVNVDVDVDVDVEAEDGDGDGADVNVDVDVDVDADVEAEDGDGDGADVNVDIAVDVDADVEAEAGDGDGDNVDVDYLDVDYAEAGYGDEDWAPTFNPVIMPTPSLDKM